MTRKLATWALGAGALALGIGLLIAQPLEWRLGNSEDSGTAVLSLGSSDAVAQTPAETREAIQMLKAQSTAFAALAEDILPSVVSITSNKVISAANQRDVPDFFGDDNIFRRFFDQMPEEFNQQGSGSGVIVDHDGLILTNNHVVDGADELEVTLYNGDRYPAELVGTDPRSDVAVIRIQADGLHPARLGDSDGLRVGEWVFAAGNPFRLSSSITYGIVSAMGRSNIGLTDYENFIQTDAAINPGNSGGALVNLDGEVVGVNTAIATRSGGYQGIGFAIPINQAKKIMNDLVTDGRVMRGFLGVQINDLNKDMADYYGLEGPRGAIVVSVTDDAPADRAGLQQGDIILEVNGRQVEDVDDLRFKISDLRPGTDVDLTVQRDGRSRNLTANLDEWPSDDDPVADAGRDEYSRDGHPFDDLGFELTNIDRQTRREFDLPSSTDGVLVTDVSALTPAGKAGFRTGDIILKVGEAEVYTVRDIEDEFDRLSPGDPIVFLVQRGEAEFFVAMRLPA